MIAEQGINTVTLDGFITSIRNIDPHAEILDGSSPGEVVLFIEPNKLPEIAKRIYHIKPFGILVLCLPHPDFLPDPDFMVGFRWW